MSSHYEDTRFAQAMARIDAANAEDPRRINGERGPEPVELVYGRRMSAMLDHVSRDASDELKLAARAQHIRRWTVPRTSYPAGKAGYHRWRNTLKHLHGDMAAEILAACGYGAGQIARVRALIGKENLARDAEVQMLEDVACLVFLQYYLPDFAAKREAAKALDILRKTCAKMSERGRGLAFELPLAPGVHDLLRQACGGV